MTMAKLLNITEHHLQLKKKFSKIQSKIQQQNTSAVYLWHIFLQSAQLSDMLYIKYNVARESIEE